MSDSIAKLIAKEVVELLKADGLLAATADSEGSPPEETIPEDTEDEPSQPPPRKRKSKAKEPEPEPEEPEDEDEDDEEETDDLVTEDALALVAETAEEAAETDMRSELLDFYTAQGHDKSEISATLADMEEEDLRESYADYLARLLKVESSIDDEPEFIEDFEEPYRTVRVFDDEPKLVWAKGGITLSDEEAVELGLGDPAAKPKAKRAPAKRTKTPGKKK